MEASGMAMKDSPRASVSSAPTRTMLADAVYDTPSDPLITRRIAPGAKLNFIPIGQGDARLGHP